MNYDDSRYQLRLAWKDGTVKSDLFRSDDEAVAAAEAWKTEVEAKKRLAGDHAPNESVSESSSVQRTTP